MRVKAKWIWLVGVLSGLAAAAVAFFLGKKKLAENVAQQTKEHLAEQLKAKVAEVKAAAVERKAETNAAVAKVDEAAQVDAGRDSVELANDLISGKGG